MPNKQGYRRIEVLAQFVVVLDYWNPPIVWLFNLFELQFIKFIFLSFQLKFHFNILWIPTCQASSYILKIAQPRWPSIYDRTNLLQFTVCSLTYSIFHYLLRLLRSVDSEGVVLHQWSEAHIISWTGTKKNCSNNRQELGSFEKLGHN